jgi:hypothetical protein
MDEDPRWQANDEEHERLEDAIREIHAAINGDNNGSLGMRKQLEEMYSVFVPVTLTGKAIIKTIMVLGAIAAAVTAIFEMVGLFKSHK